MTNIKLDYGTVIKQLEEIEGMVQRLEGSLSCYSVGVNQLPFIEQWDEREDSINQLVRQYKEEVLKSIDDTKANVQLIKDQDEAILKN
ncbi:YwqI/YxiC family protein [Bacillus carboniphilus]|uniref:YwqI/YxiC family protein n=1 Tax=Bacillus carboniphilus TaxID=86663 RepID=A0ABY9JTZ4_9BACI|nr:YwqI/YxiC family protein [Bacillus carboniphilus]WLR42876.1 YwqI/YxiC family protein [Bacillus carboniphilus]